MEKQDFENGDEGLETNGVENSSEPSDEQSAEVKNVNPAEALQKEVLYIRAEMENYKKRMLREQDRAIQFANEKLIKETLTIVDHLDLAMSHTKSLKSRTEDKELTNFVGGIEMTQRQLVQLLSRFGVEFFGATGEKFDPIRHEAISQVESNTAEPDTVLDVVQRGCLLQGRLIRPARVVVAKRHEA